MRQKQWGNMGKQRVSHVRHMSATCFPKKAFLKKAAFVLPFPKKKIAFL
jgi:hypothetical protein